MSPSDSIPSAFIKHLVESACFEEDKVIMGEFVPGDLFISSVNSYFRSVIIIYFHLFRRGGYKGYIEV